MPRLLGGMESSSSSSITLSDGCTVFTGQVTDSGLNGKGILTHKGSCVFDGKWVDNVPLLRIGDATCPALLSVLSGNGITRFVSCNIHWLYI